MPAELGAGPGDGGAGLLQGARSVCLVCLGGIGDAVWGLPVANALKEADPERRITWVVEPVGAPVLRHHAAIDEVVVFERRRGWRGARDLWAEMRGRRFDLTLNLYHLGKSIPPTVFSRAPVRVGLGRDRARDWVWVASNRHLPPAPRRHQQEQFLDFLRFLGLGGLPVRWNLALTAGERREQEEFFAPLRGRPTVALVPASANAKKDWLAERYAQVVDALEGDFGFRTVLVGGPGERETRIAREIVARAGARPVWALGDGIRRLIWLLEGSDLVIAPDTGPVHLARAVETPVIGLYGHTNPWRVGPYRAYEELWVDRYTEPGQEPDPGAQASRRGRMEQITVREVLERVERAVHGYLSPPAAPSSPAAGPQR